MSTDEPSGDPRASLVRAIGSVARNGDLDTILAGILAAATDALDAVDGRDLRPGSGPAGASPGRRDRAWTRSRSPAWRPMSPTPLTRSRSPRRAGKPPSTARRRPPTGAAFIGAYLPLIVSSGGVDLSLGSIGFGWPAPRVLDDAERATITALSSLAAVAIDRAAPGLDRRRAVRVVRADGPHRPADRSRQRADGRPDPRAGARPCRSPGQRGHAGDVRHRQLPRDQSRRRQRDGRRRPAARRRGPRGIGPPRGHGRADRRRRVRARGARVGRRGRRPAGHRRDRRAAAGRRLGRVGLGRGRPVPGGRSGCPGAHQRGDRGPGAGAPRRVAGRSGSGAPRASAEG